MQPEKNAAHLQATFSVSSKVFKKAVDRNRIKRLMREAYRLQKEFLQNELGKSQTFLIAFIIYTGNSLPDYKTIFDKMEGALRRLEKIVIK